MADKVRVRLIVEGRVQGVFFRLSTQQQSNRLGVNGWVMNRPDGNVEVVAEGDRENVDTLIQWCRQGPPGAHVTNVRIKDESYSGEFRSFDIKYSGGW